MDEISKTALRSKSPHETTVIYQNSDTTKKADSTGKSSKINLFIFQGQ